MKLFIHDEQRGDFRDLAILDEQGETLVAVSGQDTPDNQAFKMLTLVRELEKRGIVTLHQI